VERAKDLLAGAISDTISNAEVFETNGFEVASFWAQQLDTNLEPDGTQFESLEVSAADVFRVSVEKGRPTLTGGGVGIFHRETGSPMLTAADRNGDGLLDLLTYAVLDESGNAALEVVDYAADGQPDMRIH